MTSHTTNMPRRRYCIIGAGAAGLACLKAMREAGMDVVCLERTQRIGGHWHTDYDALHLITPRSLSGHPAWPMPADYPDYPSRDQMRDYLIQFARHFGLERAIRFGCDVVRLAPDRPAGRGWIVETAGGTPHTFDAVIVANGHLNEPRVPGLSTRFAGYSLHSSQYRNPSSLHGADVLVVGYRNSACDIAVDAANAGHQVTMSVKSEPRYIPKELFGRPRLERRWFTKLPASLMRAVLLAATGPIKNYKGFDNPAITPVRNPRPIVNTQLLYAVQHGRVSIAPAIEAIQGKQVTFADGSSREFETIVWATGFKVHLPFLDPKLLEFQGEVPLRWGGMTVPRGADNIYFAGLTAVPGPQLPIYAAQADLIVRFIRTSDARTGMLADYLAGSGAGYGDIHASEAEWAKQLRKAKRLLAELEARTEGGKLQSAADLMDVSRHDRAGFRD